MRETPIRSLLYAHRAPYIEMRAEEEHLILQHIHSHCGDAYYFNEDDTITVISPGGTWSRLPISWRSYVKGTIGVK